MLYYIQAYILVSGQRRLSAHFIRKVLNLMFQITVVILSLLCTISKIVTKILNCRLVSWAELNELLDDSQGAYRKGRSTVDHIFTLYAIIQKYIRKSRGRFYVAFVDFSRAFDSVPHSILWYRL